MRYKKGDVLILTDEYRKDFLRSSDHGIAKWVFVLDAYKSIHFLSGVNEETYLVRLSFRSWEDHITLDDIEKKSVGRFRETEDLKEQVKELK